MWGMLGVSLNFEAILALPSPTPSFILPHRLFYEVKNHHGGWRILHPIRGISIINCI